MRSLTEVSPPPPSQNDTEFDPDITVKIPESEPIQQEEAEEEEEEEVDYLRDTNVWPLLFNAYSNNSVQAEEGSVQQFMNKLVQDTGKRNTPERKDEIYLKEIRRYLVSHDRADLARNIESRKDIRNLPKGCMCSFNEKRWYFNECLNHEAADEYQLLSLGHRGGWEQRIPDLWHLNIVGNVLKSDLQYKEFFNRLFEELQWDDTEKQGIKKIIEIKDKYFPNMKDCVIPWALDDWITYNNVLYKYWERINIHCQLWDRVEERKEDFSEVLSDLIEDSSDDHIESLFSEIKRYIEKRRTKGSYKHAWFLIKEYFEARVGEPKPAQGDYLLYVKEKIRMALKLGIIRKEDVEESEAGSQLLKDIERYNPDYFWCDTPWWSYR